MVLAGEQEKTEGDETKGEDYGFDDELLLKTFPTK
jgi:hypothetical protein